MGRKKGSKNKVKHNNSSYESKNITSLIITFLGIFLGVILYISEDGTVSKYISNIFGGLLGNIKYIVPFILIFIGINGIFKGKDTVKTKLIQGIIGIIILSGFVSWAGYSYSNEISFTENIKQFYYNGTNSIGGGVLGYLILIPIYKMFGRIPSLIILIAITSVIVIFMTNIMLLDIIYGVRDGILRLIEMMRNDNEEDDEIEEEDIEPKKKRKIKNEFDETQMNFSLYENNEEELGENKKVVKKEIEDKVGDLNELFRVKTKEEIQKEKEEKARVQELKIKHTELENHYEDYSFPPIDLLNKATNNSKKGTAQMKETAKKLQDTLNNFGVDAKIVNVSKGPSVTRYEIQPNVGVKVNTIVNLSDDIALNLAASNIRIEAPIPGKSAVGIEVPNTSTDIVTIRELIESSNFKNADSKVSYTLGKDIGGDVVISDIAKMPHMLISGATGSGKSVCINTIITSILYNAKPNEVKLLMVDPKVVELGIYNGIPHLLIPVVTDPRKAAGALNWAVQEMVSRYNLFASRGVKDIKGYNAELSKENEDGLMPQIVIIIDELADLMMVAKKEVEDAICRLAQMARAAGMHLVIATQRPSVDVITGIIKANIPSRIAFAVSSQIDSRTILDVAGAEKLLGKGDMLYYPMGYSKPVRLQGAFVSEKEIEKVVEYIKSNQTAEYDDDIIDKIENGDNKAPITEEANEADQLLTQAIDMVVEMGQASTSMIQRRFKVGYARAGRIIDQMEARGIISGYDGSKPRQVLISKEELQELKMGNKQIEEIDEIEEEEEEIIEESNNNIPKKKNTYDDEEEDDTDELNVYAVDGDYE